MESRIGERQGGGRDRHVHLPRRAHPGADRSVYVSSQGLTGKLQGAVGPYKLGPPSPGVAEMPGESAGRSLAACQRALSLTATTVKTKSTASPTTALPGSSIDSHGSRLKRSGLCCRRGEA